MTITLQLSKRMLPPPPHLHTCPGCGLEYLCRSKSCAGWFRERMHTHRCGYAFDLPKNYVRSIISKLYFEDVLWSIDYAPSDSKVVTFSNVVVSKSNIYGSLLVHYDAALTRAILGTK